jgi:transposase-like protein
VYTAVTEQAARERLDELAGKWGERYPAIIRLWEAAWAEFVPFLAYSPEIRKVIYRACTPASDEASESAATSPTSRRP